MWQTNAPCIRARVKVWSTYLRRFVVGDVACAMWEKVRCKKVSCKRGEDEGEAGIPCLEFRPFHFFSTGILYLLNPICVFVRGAIFLFSFIAVTVHIVVDVQCSHCPFGLHVCYRFW